MKQKRIWIFKLEINTKSLKTCIDNIISHKNYKKNKLDILNLFKVDTSVLQNTKDIRFIIKNNLTNKEQIVYNYFNRKQVYIYKIHNNKYSLKNEIDSIDINDEYIVLPFKISDIYAKSELLLSLEQLTKIKDLSFLINFYNEYDDVGSIKNFSINNSFDKTIEDARSTHSAQPDHYSDLLLESDNEDDLIKSNKNFKILQNKNIELKDKNKILENECNNLKNEHEKEITELLEQNKVLKDGHDNSKEEYKKEITKLNQRLEESQAKLNEALIENQNLTTCLNDSKQKNDLIKHQLFLYAEENKKLQEKLKKCERNTKKLKEQIDLHVSNLKLLRYGSFKTVNKGNYRYIYVYNWTGIIKYGGFHLEGPNFLNNTTCGHDNWRLYNGLYDSLYNGFLQ